MVGQGERVQEPMIIAKLVKLRFLHGVYRSAVMGSAKTGLNLKQCVKFSVRSGGTQAPKALVPRGVEGCPAPHLGCGLWCPRKFFCFFFKYKNGAFLCILGSIIYRLNVQVCFTRKNGAFGLTKHAALQRTAGKWRCVWRRGDIVNWVISNADGGKGFT